jgi:hypothetical protein
MTILLDRGIVLFNSGHFFEAHEALEDVWREAPLASNQKLHLQGLVQLAVAFHHQTTGNYKGASSVLERALLNLKGAEGSFPQFDFDALLDELNPWSSLLRDRLPDDRRSNTGPLPELPIPELPKLRYRDQTR